MRDRLDFLRPPKSTQTPRDNARVFLDSRDLIDCFERKKPFSASELGELFRRRRARLIVTYTTVAEMFPGADLPSAEESERGLELVKNFDVVPHGFIRTSTIGPREFRAAYLAWQNDSREAVQPIDPFVDRFYKTTWKPIPGATDTWIEDDRTATLDRMSLHEQVRVLATQPESLRWNESYTERMIGALEEDRSIYRSKRGTRAAREAAVKRHLIAGGMSEPKGGLEAFVRWLHAEPQLCPGWRIGWDTWEEYRSNLTAPVQRGDLRDFSHLAAIPYVTHFTTDAKWFDLVERAQKRRTKDNLPALYFDGVFRDLAAVVDALSS